MGTKGQRTIACELLSFAENHKVVVSFLNVEMLTTALFKYCSGAIV
jgi:hypothetical protein